MKKDNTIAKLWKRFKEEYDDNELQRRYDGFKSTEKALVEQHNAMVPGINEKLSEKSQLERLILDSAKLGIIATEAVQKLKEVEQWMETTLPEFHKVKDKLDEERKLIKQYKDASETKLFHYWGMLKEVDETVKPWMDFKQEYGNRIF